MAYGPRAVGFPTPGLVSDILLPPPHPPDVCVGLRLQQVMKSQWQNKSLERSKPLKKLSLKHKLASSKEKHKFTNSLMAVSK